ncbi:jg25663 [Pararge aegeria aegeria]|uniref:Jg25663 protein n=1 Tax=Pararge aegeria aegeria TaxID=348720 RepID=A0A8S4QL71_9NEOP|nr:jg25663 [Pararge aegeria aegeria]
MEYKLAASFHRNTALRNAALRQKLPEEGKSCPDLLKRGNLFTRLGRLEDVREVYNDSRKANKKDIPWFLVQAVVHHAGKYRLDDFTCLWKHYGGLQEIKEHCGGLSEIQEHYGGLSEIQEHYGGLSEIQKKYGGLSEIQEHYGGLSEIQEHYGGLPEIKEHYGGLRKNKRTLRRTLRNTRTLWMAPRNFDDLPGADASAVV